MFTYKDTFIAPTADIFEAMTVIEKNAAKIAIVVDGDARLIATITDGDIRRAFLKGVSFHDNISSLMVTNPFTIREENSNDEKMILSIMQERQIHQIPVLNAENKVVGLKIFHDLLSKKRRDNWVIIMAGGVGQRLRPLTDDVPKPMLTIGNQPVLKTIIDGFINSGFYRFYISVNYKADIIKNYFGDGSNHGIDIRYIEEEKPLNTGGALGLIKDTAILPSIVINGDILTKLNFDNLLDFHMLHKATATMCVRDYNLQLPYGVVHCDDFSFQNVEEKPLFTYFINAGIYVLNPDVITEIQANKAITMTDIFTNLKNKGEKCCTYPIHEYWLDIGKIEDFHQASRDFLSIFNI